MKNLSNILGVLGVIVVLYTLLGRFLLQPTIGYGIIKVMPGTSLTVANTLLLLALLTRPAGNK